MRASIAKPDVECGSGAPAFLSGTSETPAHEKAAQERIPVRPLRLTVSSYCLFGLFGSDFGSDFGSGLLAAGCLDAPCSPA
jgi:hypothetical protein